MSAFTFGPLAGAALEPGTFVDAIRAEPAIRAATNADPSSPEYRAKALEAAEKFEAYFVAQMLQQMRRITRQLSGDEGSFSARANEDMLDMADLRVADTLARQRAFGIADIILRQVLPQPALKETASPVASPLTSPVSARDS
ncbi:MAG: rod-binding protein [Steroidobacteraceae bacterium]|nr:rod-binding protein [Steroidobacteraceae bacterium]